MNLDGKRTIITGGLSGIGRMLVARVLKAGAVVGVLDIDVAGFGRFEQEYPGARCIACDVTDPAKVQSAVDEFCREFGGVDILVNNAGILFSAPSVALTAQGIAKHDIAMWEKVISTDLSSVFYMTVNVVEKMVLKRTKGLIVNISSISAVGNAGQSAYSAAKAGVNALTKTWAKELGPLGIRVVGIAPGFIDTDSTHAALSETVLQSIIKKVPLRRLGTAEEVSHAVMAVIENDLVNGTIVEIDGGLTV